MKTHIRWIRPARQARSLETYQRILDSAEELIAEKGFDDVPVAEIARRAGFSVGAFYSRFRDKEALLHCLEERFIEEVRATADTALDPERWEGAGVAEIAEELMAFMVQIHRDRIGILREILGRTYTEPQVGARTEQMITYICEKLNALLLPRAGEMEHPDPAVAAKFSCRLVFGVLKEAILFGGPGAYGVPRSDERLATELTRAFVGYLGARASGAAD